MNRLHRPRRRHASQMLAVLLGLSLQCSTASAASAKTVDWQTKPRSSAPDVSITDIIEAKTIDSLSISPDGQWIAYRVISRSVQSDELRGQWYKRRISGSGDPIPLGHAFTPLQIMLMSLPEDGVSQWSPDSRSLYVLAETKSTVQVHRLTDDEDITVTSDEGDIVSFTVSSDELELTYQTRNSRKTIDRMNTDEASNGIHFDQSIITDGLSLNDNFRIGERVTTIRRLPDQTIGEANRGPLETKHIMLAARKAAPPSKQTVPVMALPVIRNQDAVSGEARLPTGAGKPTIILRQLRKGVVDGRPGRYRLEADLAGGKHVICDAAFCNAEGGAIRLITFDSKTENAVVLSEPDYTYRTAIQTWSPATGATRVLRAPTGSLSNGTLSAGPCSAISHYLICVEAGPTRPPRLIRLDIQGGSDLVLDDPNKELAAKHFPQTRLMNWQGPSGTFWNGVLVLPDHLPSRNLPLVITTYNCRGFLQGGTGWLTPEFALAEKGIAALCMNANGNLFGQRDEAGAIIPMLPYKLMDGAFQAVIDKLSKEGIIDPSRVGISGHSFSANAATYAISHTKLFHAAVIGSGVTIDPGTYSLVAPVADSWRNAVYEILGMPKPNNDPHHLWEDASPALNARSIEAPLLMQTTENEYLFNLQQYAYLQDAHKVVDMYVYPGEGHMASWRPIHQYWRNKRSINWFAKWLLPSLPSG